MAKSKDTHLTNREKSTNTWLGSVKYMGVLNWKYIKIYLSRNDREFIFLLIRT